MRTARFFASDGRTLEQNCTVMFWRNAILVAKYAAAAKQTCPSLTDKRVSPHVLRHTTAMELMQAGVDRTLIALWLGHESVETTQIYLDANLAIKEEALSKTTPINSKAGRYQPDDELLAFLKGL